MSKTGAAGPEPVSLASNVPVQLGELLLQSLLVHPTDLRQILGGVAKIETRPRNIGNVGGDHATLQSRKQHLLLRFSTTFQKSGHRNINEACLSARRSRLPSTQMSRRTSITSIRFRPSQSCQAQRQMLATRATIRSRPFTLAHTSHSLLCT